MKLNNKGVSLIEVLVVIGIIAILSTVSVSALVYVNKGDIKKATKTLLSEITSARTYSMAKTGDWKFEVVHNGSSFVLNTIGGADNYSEAVLSNRVDNIKVVTNSGATGTLGGIVFQKNTGAVMSITDSTGAILYSRSGAGSSLAGYADITVSISGNERTLRLYYLTGKIEQW